MPKSQYLDHDGMRLKLGDYVRIVKGSLEGRITEFHELDGGLVLVSIKWFDGSDCPAWVNDVYKVEPEELI